MSRKDLNRRVVNFKRGNKTRIIKFLNSLKDSISDSKELHQIFKNAIENRKITEEEHKVIKHHLSEILKTIGLSSLFILPLGGFVIVLIIKLSESYNIKLLPESLQLTDKK